MAERKPLTVAGLLREYDLSLADSDIAADVTLDALTLSATGTVSDLFRLYLAKRAKKFGMAAPDNDKQIIKVLARVARQRDPAFRETAEEMVRRAHRPKGSRNKKGR